jgi:ferredoxin
VLEDPHAIANGYIADVAIDDVRSFRLPTSAGRFDEQPTPRRRAPEHGQDTKDGAPRAGLGVEHEHRPRGFQSRAATRRTWTIVADRDLCMGSSVCCVYAPETFDVDDILRVLVNPDSHHPVELVRAAIAACPTGALQLVEEDG